MEIIYGILHLTSGAGFCLRGYIYLIEVPFHDGRVRSSFFGICIFFVDYPPFTLGVVFNKTSRAD